MKLYKLTDEKNKTRNDTIWGSNVSNEVGGEGKELCTTDVIHAYKHPLLASFFKQLQCPEYTKLWEAEGDVVADDGTKVGVKKLTTLKEVELPEITTEQRVKIAILCAKEVFKDEGWNNWADKWLSGEDRSADSAGVVYSASVTAANAAAAYATLAAARAAGFAYDAAYDAAVAVARAAIFLTNYVDNSLDVLSIIEKATNETVQTH